MTASFDKLLEPLKVTLDPAGNYAESIANRFNESPRIIEHPQLTLVRGDVFNFLTDAYHYLAPFALLFYLPDQSVA